MTSPYINKQGDIDVPNDTLDGRTFPMMPKVTTSRSQSDMKSRVTAGLGPTKTLSVPIRVLRDRAMADLSPRSDQSAKTAQNDLSAGNLIFSHCVCLILTETYMIFTIPQSLSAYQNKTIQSQVQIQFHWLGQYPVQQTFFQISNSS